MQGILLISGSELEIPLQSQNIEIYLAGVNSNIRGVARNWMGKVDRDINFKMSWVIVQTLRGNQKLAEDSQDSDMIKSVF